MEALPHAADATAPSSWPSVRCPGRKGTRCSATPLGDVYKRQVVGTPGRVMDLMESGALRLDGLRMLILDEADEMLDLSLIHI